MATRRAFAIVSSLVVALAGPVQAQTHSIRLQPTPTVGPAGSLVTVDVRVTATQQISLLQFSLDYDNTVATFEGATIGSDLQMRGFGINNVVFDPTFSPSSPQTNDTFLVQVWGGASAWFTGTDLRAVVLTFRLRSGVCDTSPLTFQRACGRTQMIRYELGSICAPALQVYDGVIATDCATDADGTPAVALRGELTATPNPFNPTTRLRFAIPPSGASATGTVPVLLRVHDITGRVVRTLLDEPRAPGYHDVVWNGTDDRGQPAATGIYFVQIHAGAWATARKIVLVK